MNQELLERIKNKIDDAEAAHKLENARIFLFGMNTPGDRVIQYLGTLGYTVENVLDNNSRNHGQTLFGVLVCPPEKLTDAPKDNIRVLICSRYYQEMCRQLEKMGLKEDENIIKLIDFSSGGSVSDSEESFIQAADKLYKSMEIYREITEQFDENTHFLLCPIRANGDMYMAASLIENVKKSTGCRELYLITVGGMGKRIAAFFDEDAVFGVTQEQMDALVHITEVMGSSAVKMYVLYPKAFHYGIFANMECYKGLNYMDLVAGGMLGLDMHLLNRKKISTKKNDFENSGFTQKDVLIAPYANSLPCFLPQFWVQLVEALKRAGYNVYTNSSGDMEPAVEGTSPVFIPIQQLPKLLGCFAGFVAIRNGLCDVLSEAECRKIILYPNKGMGFGSVFDFYSLNAMKMCSDAIELIYSEEKEKEIIELIIHSLEEKC